MNFGAFAGGLSKGIDQVTQANKLKQLMMGGGQGQPQGTPQMAPGFEDPNAMMSQAPMPMSVPNQPDQFTQAVPFAGLKDWMTKLFSGIGG